tara:strand:+ start:10845 stop:11654 length:810 start_codon:yes stop_codon:yes gene_type:complete
MAIKYTYLEDGTRFKAEELNTRIADAAEGVNKLEPSDFALGALRHEHLPSVVGRDPDLTATYADTWTDRSFSTFESTSSTKIGTFFVTHASSGADIEVEYAPALEISTATNVNAIILLFNVHIHRFLKNNYAGGTEGLQFGTTSAQKNFEDLVSATFVPVLIGAGGDEYVLSKASRTISPGLTQLEVRVDNSSYYPMFGQAFYPDSFTDKTVAIRSVILASDLPEGETILKIKMRAMCRFCSDAPVDTLALQYSKASLTAIPIQATVGT